MDEQRLAELTRKQRLGLTSKAEDMELMSYGATAGAGLGGGAFGNAQRQPVGGTNQGIPGDSVADRMKANAVIDRYDQKSSGGMPSLQEIQQRAAQKSQQQMDQESVDEFSHPPDEEDQAAALKRAALQRIKSR